MTLAVSLGSPRFLDSLKSAARRAADPYLFALALMLMGYALDGRGFAYVGIPPLFVGEAMLLIGLPILIGTRGWSALWARPQIWALSAFALWGIVRTVPYVERYGIDAIRDAAIYYYSAYAFIVAGLLLADPRRLATLLRYYKRFAGIFLICIPIVAAAYRFGHDSLPRWPWGDVPMIQEKEGDAMVHLGAIAAFYMSGLAGPIANWKPILLAIDAACMGVIDRAGIVAFAAAMSLGIVHNPSGKVGYKTLAVMLLGAALLAASGIDIVIPGGKGRSLSFEQIVTNVTSTFGDANNDGLDSTKEWRTNWWKDIIADTVYGSEFWGGRGFGINLADHYGYQVQQDHSLRSPHSAHMTVLARMGVPGLVIWAALQGTLGLALLDNYYRARRSRDRQWSGLFLFLGAFWIALLIDSSFDVFLEGPMGGIWFWSVYGTAVAALRIYRTHPQVLLENSDSEAQWANAPAQSGVGLH